MFFAIRLVMKGCGRFGTKDKEYFWKNRVNKIFYCSYSVLYTESWSKLKEAIEEIVFDVACSALPHH